MTGRVPREAYETVSFAVSLIVVRVLRSTVARISSEAVVLSKWGVGLSQGHSRILYSP